MKRLAYLVLYSLAASVFLFSCASVEDKWQEAEKKNSYFSYSTFARQYPDSKYTPTAKERREDLLWELAKQDDKSLHMYIKEFPDGKFAKEAEAELAWSKAKRDLSIHSYEEFLGDHPSSPHVAEAQTRISVLKDIRHKKAELSAVTRIGSSTTYCPLASFLVNYPNSEHLETARARQKDFIVKTVARNTLIRWDDPRRHVSDNLYNWKIPNLEGGNPKLASELSRMRKLQQYEANHGSFLQRPLAGQQITDRAYLQNIMVWGNSVKLMSMGIFQNSSGPLMTASTDLLLVEAGAHLPLVGKTVTKTKVVKIKVLGCEGMELSSPGSAVSYAMPYVLVPVGSTLKLSGNLPLHIFGIEVLGGSIVVKPDGLLLSKGTTLYYKSSSGKAHKAHL